MKTCAWANPQSTATLSLVAHAILHANTRFPLLLTGFRQRRRHVVREPAYTSHGCPHLVESIPCEDPVCFRWHVAFEEPCALSEGVCGPGIKSQSFVCVTAQGTAHGGLSSRLPRGVAWHWSRARVEGVTRKCGEIAPKLAVFLLFFGCKDVVR